LTTWQWPQSYGWAIPFPSDFDPRAESASDVNRVVKAEQDAEPEVVIHTHIVDRPPAPTLVEASHEADLLVVYGEFAGMLLGSVGEYCAHHARCPAVVIR